MRVRVLVVVSYWGEMIIFSIEEASTELDPCILPGYNNHVPDYLVDEKRVIFL